MKTFLFITMMSLFCLNVNAQEWVQMGNDIDGTNAGNYFGKSASLSSDGNTVAVGAPRNSEGGNKAGQVKVFSSNGTSWVQKGNNINGDPKDQAYMVELSDDGNIVAVGAMLEYNFKARIFDFNGSEWIQRGATINGPMGAWNEGQLSLNANGNIVAFSSPGLVSGTHLIRIYKWSGTSWDQLGSDISGPSNSIGRFIKINADGYTLIVGTPDFTATSYGTGKVSVYQYNGSEWVLKGNEIIGEQPPARLGSSVDISDDGNTIIAGETGYGVSYNGRTRVFSWNGTDWEQKGSGIEGLFDLDDSGVRVAINGTGNTFATAGNGYGELGNVRIFEFNGTDWEQLGQTFEGGMLDAIGYGLDFSTAGDILSIGNIRNNDYTGQLKVYHFDGTADISTNSMKSLVLYPNPTEGNFTLDLGKEYTDVTVQILNTLGQIISSKTYPFAKIIQQEINSSEGIYFVKVSTPKEGSSTLQIIKQ